MFLFQQVPLLRFFFPLLLGVYIGNIIEFNSHTVLFVFSLIAIISFVVFLFFRFKNEKKAFEHRWIYGIFLSISIAFSGILISAFSFEINNAKHFSNYDFNDKSCMIVIDEAPSERKNSIRTLSRIESVKVDNKWVKTNGKVLLYFEKDSASQLLRYGDKIILKANFTETNPPQNPHEFNYKKYLAFNNIYHQGYKKSGYWNLIENGNGSAIFTLSYRVREKVLEQLSNHGIKGQNYALVSALLLGMKDALDNDMLKEFSAAGAMHVLCVSGLHVGIIFLVINLIFGFLDRSRKGKYIKAFLVILLIWFYALITGLSPSVMRAATMFSIITIGTAFNKNTCIYNSLFLSAIILIIINPFIISKLGFWLSYFAVVGIVYLYPKFYHTIKFRNFLADKIWALICVSLAAQIATSPISIYYFSQFPNYFLISNIVVVPLATLIVYSGIISVVMSFLPYISDIFALILSYELSFLRKFVHIIDSLPFSTTLMVINKTQMFLAYLLIILIIVFFKNRKAPYLKAVFIFTIIIAVFYAESEIKSQRQQKFIVYKTGKGLSIDFIEGQRAIFVCDEQIRNDENLLAFHIGNYRLKNKIKNIEVLITDSLIKHDGQIINSFYAKGNHILFNNEKIIFINKHTHNLPVDMALNGDYIIFQNLPKSRNHNFIDDYLAPTHIYSTTLRNYEKEIITKEINSNIIHDINKNGAFINYKKPVKKITI